MPDFRVELTIVFKNVFFPMRYMNI
jgi:hypothetical protein